MKIHRDLQRFPEHSAGFMFSNVDAEIPELKTVGEHWTPEGYQIHAHDHPVWEFYFQISGTSQWRVGRTIHKAEPGALLAIPPHRQHLMHSRASEDLHYCFASLDIEPIRKRFPDWPDPFSTHEVFSCSNVPDVGAAFVALIREVMLIRPMRVPALRLSLDALVLSIVRSTLDRSENKNAVGWHRGVEAAVELVRRNPGDHWNLRKLSRMAGLSEGHLTHLFRTQIGQSPHRFIMTTRLERAREQLTHSDLSITQIALELGFSSSQHLSTSFRNHFQISPRELKRSLENPVEIRPQITPRGRWEDDKKPCRGK